MEKRFCSLVIAVLLLVHCSLAQLKERSVKFRDRAIENEVARTFEDARKTAGAKPLTRIRDRDEVQEFVCTAALNDRVPVYRSGVPALGRSEKWRNPASLLYKTREPAKVTDEINRLATLDPNHKVGYKRYAVAVWRSSESVQPQQYWVGIQLYPSAALEFFDDHFTDDVWYHNEWKSAVADQCRKR